MPIDSLGNISGGYGGISSMGGSGGLILGGIKLPYSNLQTYLGSIFNIPGWTTQQNQTYNDTMTQYNSIDLATQRAKAQGIANQLNNYDAMAQAQAAKDNTAIKNLYTQLNAVSGQGDDFLSSQLSGLQAAGVDSSTIAALAAAGATSGVGNFNTVSAQVKMAMQAQQDYLDYIQTPNAGAGDGLEGQDKLNAWYANIASKDINGVYATELRNTVADLVEKLNSIQDTRNQFMAQTTALASAAQLANTAKTAQALMGIDTAAETVGQIEQTATIGSDVSPLQTTTKSNAQTQESRGGGRYVSTTAKSASGLRL